MTIQHDTPQSPLVTNNVPRDEDKSTSLVIHRETADDPFAEPSTVIVAAMPTPEEAMEMSKPHVWLSDVFFHARGKGLPGCIPFTCIPPAMAGRDGTPQVVYAHRLPLAARSEAFYFMLYVNDLPEVVVHCRANVFEAFLQFLYTETLPQGIPHRYTLVELMQVAESYQCHVIERQLADIIGKTLTSGNVIDLLLTAVGLNSSHLQRLCARYINTNQAEVVQSKPFRDLRMQRNPTEVQLQAVKILSDAVFHNVLPLPPAPPHAIDYNTEELTDAEIDDPTECTLAADLSRACASNIGADVQLVSRKDSKAVWCSQWLVAVRSPHFAEMLMASSGAAGAEVEAELARNGCRARAAFDVSSEALQALVLFLYSGELSAPTDVLCELVPLAHEAELDALYALLGHVPAATVTAISAVPVLIALKERSLPTNGHTQKVIEMCYTKIQAGWRVAAPALGELVYTDLVLFLRTLGGAFSDSVEDRIDDHIALMHWRTMPDNSVVKHVLLDFIQSAGDMNFETSPLACKDLDQVKLSLRVLDFTDDLGAKVLSERLAHTMVQLLGPHQIFDFTRMLVDSHKLGTGGGRDALLIKLLPSIATLPSINSILNHDHAMHLLRHVRVSDHFPGKQALEKKLIENTVTHTGDIDQEIYTNLPFDIQMRILSLKMEQQPNSKSDKFLAIAGPKKGKPALIKDCVVRYKGRLLLKGAEK